MSSRRLIVLSLVFTLLAAVSLAAQERLNVFLSFEDKNEIATLRVSPGVQISQSTHFPTWKENSLEAVFPAGGGQIALARFPEDWRLSGALLVFAWCEQPSELTIALEDSTGASFRKSFGLRTGANHIQFDLSKTRGLNLGKMKAVRLESPAMGKMYLDYIALDRYNQLLDERGRFDFRYKMDVETPHFKWGNPLPGGPINVYALSGIIDGRGIIELTQRLDINFTTTSMGVRDAMNLYGFGEFYEERGGGTSTSMTYVADDILNGPDYDVILWPGLRPWESYPQSVRDRIRHLVVDEGKGLVLFSPTSEAADGAGLWELSPLTGIGEHVNIWPEDKVTLDSSQVDQSAWTVTQDHFITRGLALDAFPQGKLTVITSKPNGEVLVATKRGAPVLAVRQAGKGRVVAFGYSQRGMIPEVPRVWDTGLQYNYWEYMWSMIARATLWAAGRESSSGLASIERKENKVTVPLLHAAGPQEALCGRLTDDHGQMVTQYDIPLKPGAKSVVLDIPASIPGGRSFLDLKLTKDGNSLDWATLIVDQRQQVKIESLTLDTGRVQLGGSLTATVKLSAPSKSACTLVAGLYDNYGRLLGERKEPLNFSGALEKKFEFSTAGALSHLARVECRLEGAQAVQDRAEAEVFVLQKRLWDDFDIVMYLFGPSPMPGIWTAIDSQMQRMRVTTLSSYPVSLCKHANYMVQAQTRVSGQESPDDGPDRDYYDNMKKKYLATGDKMGLVRKYCLNDPAYRELIHKQLIELATPWVPFSPLSYYVLEEPSFTCYGDAVDICFSEHTLSAMRDWLKTRYASLDALNRQWGTVFGSWDKVIPDDAKEAQARGNYSSWADHRSFMELTYANSYKMLLDELRQLDPNARMLNSGTQTSGSHNGCDYSQLNQYTLHLNAYEYEVHRSMNQAVKISGGAGYGVMGKHVLRNFYQNLFKGANGGLYVFWQYCTVDPDLTLNQSALDMLQGFDELRGQGIGKLVGLALPDNNGIAVHYSYPSIHGAWIVDGKVADRVTYHTSESFDRFKANNSGWLELLRDCGLQFDFIPYSSVEKGGLIEKGYRTFILPMSYALSQAETDEIVKFVEAGGTVIADGLPGVMDEHCAFRDNPKLHKLFGIKTGPSSASQIKAGAGDLDLKPEGAQVLNSKDKKSMLMVNRYGKGQAWLLNYFHDSYAEDKLNGKNGPALEAMRKVMVSSGIAPKVRLTGADGAPVIGCERYLFNNGSTRLLGLIPDMERPAGERIEVQLGGSYAIYDVRHKSFLGVGDRFLTRIEPGVPQLFAFVAERITGIHLESPRTALRGAEIPLDFKTSGAGDLRSVVSVTVTDPSGKERRIYGGNRDIVNSAGAASFRTALNDPAGDWIVEVTEVASGERDRAVIKVE